ncbi:hypothetical protein ACFQ0B_65195 [Nonomuraea thailandensis]
MSRDAVAEARRRYGQERDKKVKAGTWRGLVDAQQARQHVLQLHRTWLISYEAIGQLAGLTHTAVRHIIEEAHTGSSLHQLGSRRGRPTQSSRSLWTTCRTTT